ncbi:MAG: TonB family protein [bacterium]
MIKSNNKRFTPFESPDWSLEVKPESELNKQTRAFFAATVDSSQLIKQKSLNADLRHQSKKIYELSLLATIGLLIVGFQFARQFSLAPGQISELDVKIEVADIPPTEQFRQPIAPMKPSIPVPTEEEAVPEDMTIASTELDLSDIPPPPSAPDENDEMPIFVAFDEPPSIIGGIAALNKFLKYPQLARQAGVEGIVYVKVLVSADGRTERVEVLKAKPANLGFEQAAKVALKKVKWQPAKQRDRNIRVWVSVPIEFSFINS